MPAVAVSVRAPSRSLISSRRAPISSPAKASSPMRPSKTLSQKRRRARGWSSVRRTCTRKISAKRASRPIAAGMARSISARRRRARAGAAPPVEMAMVIGDRSTIAGMMKLDSFGRSTTLTGTQRCWAASDTRAWSASSSLATTTSDTPARSSSSKARPAQEMRPSPINWAISPTTVSAIRVTCAPADSSSSTLRAAASVPPATRARRPCRDMKSGKVCITRPRAVGGHAAAPAIRDGTSRSWCPPAWRHQARPTMSRPCRSLP